MLYIHLIDHKNIYCMWKIIYKFFDKLEDKIRGQLSRKPILYAFVGGVGMVLFWRGVWHLADTFMFHHFSLSVVDEINPLAELSYFDGFLSLLVGSLLLLMSGLFVSHFIGNEIIIKSGETTHFDIILDTGIR